MCVYIYIFLDIVLLNNFMNCKCLKVFLTIIWYNKKLCVRKLHNGRPWFFIPYSLNEIIQILQMKMK